MRNSDIKKLAHGCFYGNTDNVAVLRFGLMTMSSFKDYNNGGKEMKKKNLWGVKISGVTSP